MKILESGEVVSNLQELCQQSVLSSRYLVLWSRLRCFRALRAGPGSGQLRWANVWPWPQELSCFVIVAQVFENKHVSKELPKDGIQVLLHCSRPCMVVWMYTQCTCMPLAVANIVS